MISKQAATVRLFEKTYLVLEYDAQEQLLIQNWKGFASSVQFREGIEKSIDVFKQHKVTRLLSNTKDSAVVKKEDTDWAATYAVGKMLQHGLRSMAFIIPTNAFTQMSVKNFSGLAGGALDQQFFDDVDKAIVWLTAK
ncbi:hypothetical protein [Cesiribacter andamanensis]|uniref:STAS/SEC14 domain-containing protein n=1 Tax=Cesiribacter andamanensis AMV16 TaxID=1279009 RepID=M7N2V7_9BACT|nr:hypothetical protein [Cesiribacter andamanensis]EMR01556.1 hypothetical protein ADICEAN_03317 [Cesiribacter andamanensis AMV16]